MATDEDKLITQCTYCHGQPIAPFVQRNEIRVQLNEQGGIWPNQHLDVGDTLEVAFRKNGGNWGLIPRQYKIKYAAEGTDVLVAYMTLTLGKANFGE